MMKNKRVVPVSEIKTVIKSLWRKLYDCAFSLFVVMCLIFAVYNYEDTVNHKITAKIVDIYTKTGGVFGDGYVKYDLVCVNTETGIKRHILTKSSNYKIGDIVTIAPTTTDDYITCWVVFFMFMAVIYYAGKFLLFDFNKNINYE